MSEAEVTAYIEALEEPKRSTLEAVRRTLLDIEPGLEQVIAWNTPIFRYNGKNVAGLCAHKNHMTYSPQSAEVMAGAADALEGYVISKASFQFAVDTPLPRELVAKLLQARLSEIGV
jgi:uncharacterized protein YdhG (YjbR/CyaY superfamily)